VEVREAGRVVLELDVALGEVAVLLGELVRLTPEPVLLLLRLVELVGEVRLGRRQVGFELLDTEAQPLVLAEDVVAQGAAPVREVAEHVLDRLGPVGRRLLGFFRHGVRSSPMRAPRAARPSWSVISAMVHTASASPASTTARGM